MLLPLQGESAVVYSSPRAPLRSALGYEQVAPSGRTDGIIPPTISSQPNYFFRAKNHLSSCHFEHLLKLLVAAQTAVATPPVQPAPSCDTHRARVGEARHRKVHVLGQKMEVQSAKRACCGNIWYAKVRKKVQSLHSWGKIVIFANCKRCLRTCVLWPLLKKP